MRTGYLISTASNQTAPNLGTTKGYTVFYEGNIITNAAAVAQVFDSFELIVAPELAQALAEETAQAAEATEGGGEGDDDEDEDNAGDGDEDEGDNEDGQGLAQRIIEETEERIGRIIGR
jgi:phosphopantothenoylcysteine synthetase/decarboxylase